MQDLYETVKDELDDHLPDDDQSYREYSHNALASIKETLTTNRKAQAGVLTGAIYLHDGFMTKRYGFLDRDEWHSFQIGFSDGYTYGEEISADLASEPHYYATGRTCGTAVRDGQEFIMDIGDSLF